MPNKHFCQGPHCHTHVTQDRFLKSRGVIRGRYAYADRDRTPNSWGYTPNGSDVYFCSQSCKFDWKTSNMVDRLSLSDTDERVVAMLKLRMKKVGGAQNILFKGCDNLDNGSWFWNLVS